MTHRWIGRVFGQEGPSLQRLRLATCLLVASFSLLVVATAFIYLRQQHAAAVETAARTTRSAANAVQAQATRTFIEAYRVLEGISEVYAHGLAHGGFSEGDLHELLAQRLRATPGIYVFALFDKDLKGVASGLSYPIAIERYRYMPLGKLEAAGNDRLFGPLYRNPPSEADYAGEWSLPLGQVIRNRDGTVAGYSIALINTRYFSEFLATIDVGPAGEAMLCTADGRLIAASPNVRTPKGDFPPMNEPREAGAAITVAMGIEDLPAAIAVTLDSRDYLDGWRQTRTQIISAVVALVAVMGLFTVIILRQLSHSQTNENALRQAKAAAEEANEAKSRFLAHMSHEFRTPLNAIMGFAEIIRGKVLGDGVSSAYTSYADHIHRSGEHLLNIVNDILDMAKIESGAQPLQQDTIDLHAAVSAATSFVQGLATQRSLRIVVDMPTHLPYASGDERFIRQMLINLLSNAIKFSPPDSEILVRAEIRADDGLDISVKDSGPGIEPSLLRRLGEPFLQGNPALSHLGKGTGLGLSICKRYMDLLGGELKLESWVGVGTTATIRFPGRLLIPDEDD